MKQNDIDRYVELKQVKIPHLTDVIQNLSKERAGHQEAVSKLEHQLRKSGEGTRLFAGKDGYMAVVSRDKVEIMKLEDYEQE